MLCDGHRSEPTRPGAGSGKSAENGGPGGGRRFREVGTRLCSASAHLKLGESLMKLGRNQEAVVQLSEAVRLAPSDVEAQFGLGIAYTGLGRYRDALDLYRRVLKIRPNASDV